MCMVRAIDDYEKNSDQEIDSNVLNEEDYENE